MNDQQRLTFDDPDSKTRNGALNTVWARAEEVRPFDRSLFGNFLTFRALTYTSSIPMVMGLLRDYDYDGFECVFGHNGILSHQSLWPSSGDHGQGITSGTFYSNLRRYLRMAGLPPSGVHIFRHSAAKLRREAGESIKEVSRFLDTVLWLLPVSTSGGWKGTGIQPGGR